MRESVLCLLEESAAKYPDKIAVADETRSLTYTELVNEAKKVGTWIADHSPKGDRNRAVAVLIDRNVETLITFFGAVYSGNFYASIGPDFPEDRRNSIIESLDAVCVVDARRRGKDIPGAVRFSEIADSIEADEKLLSSIREDMIDTDPLYTIFTSGSTGVPKGVLISHKSVLDLTDAFRDAFGFDEDCVFGNQAPFDFDVSVKDIYNSLAVGGTVHILPKKMFAMPGKMAAYLAERKINTLIWAVSAANIMARFDVFGASAGDARVNLRYLMFSGEVMPVHTLTYWQEQFPEARFVNLYGPTEITCNCTYFEVKRRYADDEIIPIGRAFRNTRVFLLDDDERKITEPGIEGELCVEGTGLALGYWNMSEKTAEAFPQNPFMTGFHNRIYRTGDLARYDEDGELCYAARKDFQIKHFGHRIELQEIERNINAAPNVDVCACVFDREHEKIVCCYMGEEDRNTIIRVLAEKVPKYMFPQKFLYFKHLPLTAHGKIDRKKLLEIAIASEGQENEQSEKNLSDRVIDADVSVCSGAEKRFA